MSEENVEVTRGLLPAFHRRDLTAWLAACDPELENHPSREWPEAAPIRGAEAVWNFLVEVAAAWDEVEFEWGEVIDAGPDKVVGNQRAEPRGKMSGAGVPWSFWVVFTLRERRVLRMDWFTDREEAVEAAGLTE
jgi:ketosteroid isomerase-like protein